AYRRAVPQAQFSVPARRHKFSAVRFVRDAEHDAVLAPKRTADLQPALGVPEVDVAGEVAGRDRSAVGREADGEDADVVRDGAFERPSIYVPDEDLAVEPGGGEELAVGGEVEILQRGIRSDVADEPTGVQGVDAQQS